MTAHIIFKKIDKENTLLLNKEKLLRLLEIK